MTYNAMISEIPMPARIRALPVTAKGFPALFFASKIDGEYELRVADSAKRVRCFNQNLCWLCGAKLGKYKSFVIGPMCVVNLTTSEPPSHLECSRYACTACPFLTKPRARRNSVDLPDEAHEGPGVMIDRNPGASCIYTVTSYKLIRVSNGVLVALPKEPHSVEWWAGGKRCGREPVLASIDSGYPILMEMAKQEGWDAVAQLERQHEQAMRLVPNV
jgi:hypothetical protein